MEKTISVPIDHVLGKQRENYFLGLKINNLYDDIEACENRIARNNKDIEHDRKRLGKYLKRSGMKMMPKNYITGGANG